MSSINTGPSIIRANCRINWLNKKTIIDHDLSVKPPVSIGPERKSRGNVIVSGHIEPSPCRLAKI